jgi:hypothetical protein
MGGRRGAVDRFGDAGTWSRARRSRGRVREGPSESALRGACSGLAPAAERFSSEHGPVLAFCGEDLGVLGVGIAPTAVVADGRGQLGVALVVGVGDGELPERSEMGLD